MSDYSPPPSPDAFDELEEVLYDADPAPDLADELASHALHSPLLYGAEYEPGYDLQEYHSDWEYYSDDYYDDDPSILKKNPIDGSPIRNTRIAKENATGGRSRKRKLADRDSDVLSLMDDRRYLENCMKGIVWAQPEPARDNVYRVGQGEKVALLKDWRTKFGTASPKKSQRQSKTKPTLSKDESWANDLSLADMGLLTARGTIAPAPEDDDDDDDDERNVQGDEEEEYDDEEDLGGDEVMEEDLNGVEDVTPIGEAEARPSNVRPGQTSPEPEDADVEEQPNKRRKRATAPSAPTLPSPPATNGSITSHSTRRTRNRADSASTAASVTLAKSSEQQNAPAEPQSRTSRKRKASPADEGDTEDSTLSKSHATAPTTSSRAKRVASTAHNVVSDKSKTAAPSGPARATRSKKK